MDHFRLLRRAAALLAAAGLFAVLVAGISADGGNEEAVVARALKPTQARAEVPTAYNELFTIQWGGGSLYHLKARLATMGCMLNTIWVYDNNRWFSYNQYNVPHSFNQPFLNQFIDTIPATTLYGDCIDICTFDAYTGEVIRNHRCLSFEKMKEDGWFFGFDIQDETPCTDNFHPTVKQKVFPLLAILPNTCIVHEDRRDETRGVGGIALIMTITDITPFITLYIHNNNYRSRQEFEIIKLNKEIHELCHINQGWQWVEQLKTGMRNKDYKYFEDSFYNSPQGKEFIQLTDFILTGEDQYGVKQWKLPTNSIYRDIYHINPSELSAELCTMYIMDKIGERSKYDYQRYNRHINLYDRVPIRNTDLSKYLTPEIVEWLEKYMVLPYPNAGEE